MAEYQIRETEQEDISKGHETYFPPNCDPCNYEGIKNEANGYCEVCSEFLCSRCIQHHRKFQITRSHDIAIGDKMPVQTSAQSHSQPTITPLIFCEEHRSNEVEFFCSSHKTGFCGLCRATKHGLCDVKTFYDAVSFYDVTALPDATNTLQCFVKEFEKEREKYESYICIPRESIQISRNKIAECKERVLTAFSNLEKEIDCIAKEGEQKCKVIKEDIKLCSDIINHLMEQLPYLKDALQIDNEKAKFMAMLKTLQLNNECAILKDKLRSQTNKGVQCKFDSIQNETLETVLKKLQEIGQLIKVPNECDNLEPPTRTIEQGYSRNSENPLIKKVTSTEENSSYLESNLSLKMPLTPLRIGKFGQQFSGNTCAANNKDISSIQNVQTSKTAEQKSQTFVEALVKPTEAYTKEDNTAMPKYDTSAPQSDKNFDPFKDDLRFLNKYFKSVSYSKTHLNAKKNFSHFKRERSFYKQVRASYDTKSCDITGVAILETGNVVLCDHANNNVKLLGSDFKLLNVCRTNGKPWDVARRNGTNEIVVTVTTERLLQFLVVVKDELKVLKAINTRYVCWGIAIYKDRLFVTQHNKPGGGRLEIRKMCGSIIKQILLDDVDLHLLKAPSYIHVHETVNQTSIYMSDGYDKAVICLDLTKELVEKISSQAFQWPKGIITDDSGNCLLCLCKGDNVKYVYKQAFVRLYHNKKDTGKKFSIIVNDCVRPQSIDIRWSDHTLVVGSSDSDNILVIKCTYSETTNLR